jgi:hypothetical protein
MYFSRTGACGFLALLVCAAACGKASEAVATQQAWQAVSTAPCGFSQVASSTAELDLSSVEALDVDSRGRIYLADRLKGGVIVTSPDGRYLRTIGRRGRGPGEFEYLRNVQVLAQDSILVYDAGLYRMSVFAPDSAGIAYDRLMSTSAAPPPNWVEKLPGQRALFATHRKPYAARAGADGDVSHRDQTVRLVEWDGRTRKDSVLVLPAVQPLIARDGRAVAITTSPFARPGQVRVGADGRIYYGWGDSLAIAIYTPEGQRSGGFSHPFRGPPVTRRDLQMAGKGMGKGLQRALKVTAPDRWPAFRDFIVDDAGRIWIGLVAPAGQPTKWTAFSDTGSPICSAELPAKSDVRLIRGENAYVVTTDEMDVPRLLVYHVPSAPRNR